MGRWSRQVLAFAVPGNPGDGAVNKSHRAVVRGKVWTLDGTAPPQNKSEPTTT